MYNLVGRDTAYPGVEILPNGEIVTTTYGHWEANAKPYIVSSRFRLSEIDAEYNGQEYCGQSGTVEMSGDINRDCYVDFDDLKIFLSYWFESSDPAEWQ